MTVDDNLSSTDEVMVGTEKVGNVWLYYTDRLVIESLARIKAASQASVEI